MSLIKDTGAAGSITDLVLENSLQKIGIECYQGTAITDANLTSCTVSINRVRKSGGATPIIYPMSLQYLLEMAACNEGAYRATSTAGTTVIGTIDISNFGTLQLGSDEYMQLSLTNAVGGTFGVRLYAIEGANYTPSSIQVQLNSVLADTPKVTNVSDCRQLALPVTNLTKIVMQYSDGRTATYTPIELQMICQDINDIVSVLSPAGTAYVPIYGYSSMFVVGIEDVVLLTVQYSAISKYYTVRDI